MKLGYFTMPLHTAGQDWRSTLLEDRECILLADELGFHDAFVGEHLTDRHESITNSMIFLASLAFEIKQIKLGTGTTNLSQQHPVLVAANGAMLDHLLDGRFILGVSPGALASDAEVLGILNDDRNALFADSIEAILAIWDRKPPYDISAGRFHISTAQTYDELLGVGILPKPRQLPRPEIIGTVVAPFSKGVVEMGKRNFHPLSANFLLPQWVATHWPKYVEGREAVGEVADPDDWRIARTIFVADDPVVAENYAMRAENSPYRFYYDQMYAKMKELGRLNLFKRDQEISDDEVTLDQVMDDLVIYGTPEQVAAKIQTLREQVGPFGEIVYAGLEWVDPTLARRSMELMAKEVMPILESA